MNALGEKADPLKKVLESVNEIIQLYLTFLINKVGPIAIFCLISRTFAIYGTEYLAPAAAYIVAAMVTLFVLVVTIYPIGIWVTTKMNPIKFIKKNCEGRCVRIFNKLISSMSAAQYKDMY